MSEFAAIDLGASSGRVMLGRLDDGEMALQELHRFENVPVRLPDGMRWNLLHLFSESIGALQGRSLAGVGVDTWGVDYGLLDRSGHLLGVPFHYRDDRTTGMVERASERVPEAEQYAVSGIQTMPINTVFQLLADEGSPALANAHAIALVPDLLAYWLSGELANEKTNASTTALLDARSGEWAHELIGRLGIPTRPSATWWSLGRS
jgi:rhamnulokinase